jgi:hypothetical protein
MAWSVAACRVDKNAWGPSKDDLEPIDNDHEAVAVFAEAARVIKKKGADADWRLHFGRLWSKDSGRALGQALGTGLMWSGEWYPDKVKELAQTANWDFEVPDELQGFKDSAQAFLRICADQNLGIMFM